MNKLYMSREAQDDLREIKDYITKELEKGRRSGETEGWLTPEEVRAHFRARAKAEADLPPEN